MADIEILVHRLGVSHMVLFVTNWADVAVVDLGDQLVRTQRWNHSSALGPQLLHGCHLGVLLVLDKWSLPFIQTFDMPFYFPALVVVDCSLKRF